MKFSIIIFSIYLLGLSCFSCVDRDDCIKFDKSETTFSSADNQQKNQQPNSDLCTPFCSCSHCPSSAFYQFITPFIFKPKLVFSKNIKQIGLYSFRYSNQFTSNIWQPPKLS